MDPAFTPVIVADLLGLRAEDDGVGVQAGDRSWTWREVVAASAGRAAVLAARRRPGPFHVGVLSDNTPDYLFTLFGAALAGATVVGLNPTRRGAELARDVRHTDCQLVVADAAGAALLDGLDLGGIPVVPPTDLASPPPPPPTTTALGGAAVDLTPGAPADLRSPPAAPAVPVAPAVDPTSGVPGDLASSPSPLPSATSIAPVARAPAGPGDTFVLIFTSGSTGAPKAVRMTHGRATRAGLAATWFGADDVLYCAMPLFHGNALNAIVLPALFTGAAIALRERFSASAFMPDVRRYGATFFSTVGRALAYVLATDPSPDDRDHRVKFALAPESSPVDVRAFRARFGIHCVTGYGSSENAVVMVPVAGMPKDALGVPQDGIDAAVVDPDTGAECPRARIDADGRLLNAGEAIGEIVGRNVLDRFEGYYNNPEAEAERTRGGWYWSGDLGYVDEGGLFYFAGRVGEWLRVDSENFATAPVERVLGRFPGVSGVVVYPVPDERTADDQVMAAVEMAAGVAFDPEAFARFLAEQPDLGTKWAPRYVRVTRLPVGATGKIDRRTLRAERWATPDPVFWRPTRTLDFQIFTPTDRTALEARFAHHGRTLDRI
jgi:fatty-acyl-CoA synthase